MEEREKRGHVYLIGAGPGEPKLLTLRAVECLRQAEVVVYDYLVHPAMLRHAGQAEQIYVGKRGGSPSRTQEEINALLVERGQSGQVVARLKGGDPFVFGRGGEEALCLQAAQISFEVVPGVTSAIAAPAYAGIPVTHRGKASLCTFITGHEDPTKDRSDLDWALLGRSEGTLVFLMGISHFPQIVRRLLDEGRPPKTPLAVIHWGTYPRQQTRTTTLQSALSLWESGELEPPSIVVVGEVVSLRQELNWFERRPLFGRTVVVTRSRAQSSDLTSQLEALGAEVVEFPTIRIAPPVDEGAVRKVLGELEQYDWILFTSVHGVEGLLSRLWEEGRDSRALAGVRLGCIGPATAEALASYGLRADLLPRRYVAEGVLDELEEKETVKEKRFLLPRAERARSVLPETLRARGAVVDVVTLYQTLPEENDPAFLRSRIEAGEIAAVTFTSSSTVHNFVASLGQEFLQEHSGRFQCISIGPVTTQTLGEYGLEAGVTASVHTIPGLVEGLVHFFCD